MAAPTLQTGFALPQDGAWTGTAYRSSPIFADVNGDGRDELIAVASGSRLIAYTQGANGAATPAVTYQAPGAVADIKSTPIVVTDNRTGRKELFAALGRDETNSGSIEDGRIFGWDLATGQLLPGWTTGQDTGRSVDGTTGVYGALASGDLDGDGNPEIIATSFSSEVVAYHLDGSVMWRYNNNDTILSGAVVGDLDRDGRPEVVLGGDSSASPFFQDGGWVTVLDNNGQQKYRRQIVGEVTWSSPVLADLYNDGNLEIIIGTGLNFDFAGKPGARAAGNYLYAFDAQLNILSGWPYHLTNNDALPHEVLAAPAVADLNGDGVLEVIAVDRSGYLHVVEPNGQPLPAFAGGLQIARELGSAVISDNYSSPIVADITGDGRPEVIAASGPFLKGIDADGNVTAIATTTVAPGTATPEGIDSAAAVGRFNGGPDDTLAFVSYVAAPQNRSDQVRIFQLPATTTAPQWPMIRRTAEGIAVRRSRSFDDQYVRSSYLALTGQAIDAGTLAAFDSLLDSNRLDLLGVSRTIARSDLARGLVVDDAYARILGRPADPGGRAAFVSYLGARTVREMDAILVDSAEFAARGGDRNGQIGLIYQIFLNRTASPGEIAFWNGTGESPGLIAFRFLNSDEYFNNQIRDFVTTAYGSDRAANLPADTEAAFSFDIHRGVREEDAYANLLVSGGAYATTQQVSGYVRTLYRDILQREAGTVEVASWLRGFDFNVVGVNNLAAVILGSVEAHQLYVREAYRTFLGREADAGAVMALGGYARREDVALLLVGSDEYFARNGGTNASFVRAAYRDLGGIGTVSDAVVNSWLARFAKGEPRSVLSTALVNRNPLYGNVLAVALAFRYLPDESLGVLRTANLPPSAAGQPVNPNPGLLAYLVNLYVAGKTNDDLIATLTTAPGYIAAGSYHKGIYRSTGIRN